RNRSHTSLYIRTANTLAADASDINVVQGDCTIAVVGDPVHTITSIELIVVANLIGHQSTTVRSTKGKGIAIQSFDNDSAGGVIHVAEGRLSITCAAGG